MWKDTLLQGLIALLPVFLFLVWYDRPARARYASLFMGISCGIAMLLNQQFSIVLAEGLRIDLRLVPMLVGALFGGVPVASCLIALYAIFRYYQVSENWEYVYISVFLAVLLLMIFKYAASFGQGTRHRRAHILLLFSAFFFVYFSGMIVIHYGGHSFSLFTKDAGTILVCWVIFLCAMIGGINFTEVAFERVRLQRELQEMSHKYRAEMRRLQQLIDQTPLAVIFFDSNGSVTHINESSLKLLHPLTLTDVLSRHYEAFSQMFPFESPSPIDRVMRGEDRVVEMIHFRQRTLYTVTCAVKGLPGQSSDGILFIGHDVTELQQLKDEVGRMERLSLVGQMAASITHEIRNPMAVIRGFVQLLNERSPTEQHSYFRIVMEELDRANAIINDFLSLAQNRIVEKEPCNLHDILNDIMPLIWADANMRGQIVELRLSPEMPILEINSKEIKQLVLNLARNGMEAMKDNGVLRIETQNQNDTVQLRVVDNGVGIPKEQLERLFEPFYTTKTNGTGLGLALCLSIMEHHNGKIEVESTVGEGTAFVVSFTKPAGF